MTGLEDLKKLAYENACCRCQYFNKKCTNKYTCIWKSIKKELEAFEIIKKKQIDVYAIIESKDLDNLKARCWFPNTDMIPTQEEYDFLKEVLEYEQHSKNKRY